MTERAAAQLPGPARFDELWRPAHWRDEVGGEPHGGFFVGIVALAIIWKLVAHLWLPGVAGVIANVALAVALIAAARRRGLSFEELGLRRDRVGRGLWVGAVAGGLVLVALAIAVAVPSLRSAFEDPAIARHDGATDAYIVLVRIPFGTVVLEEALFRGVLLALALRRWPVRTAVLVTSGLFGLWHIVNAAENADGGALAILGAIVGTVAVTSVAGLIFNWLRLRANSIVAPAIAHIATNSLAYLAVVVALELR